MSLFKRLLSIVLCIVVLYSPYAHAAAWYQIEVIAFEHKGDSDSSEGFTSDVGEPLWSKGNYLLDEEEANDRRAELLAKAQAADRADASAQHDPQTQAAAESQTPQAAAQEQAPEGFVSVESLLEQHAPKPAPVTAQATPAPTPEPKSTTKKVSSEIPFVDLPPSAFTLNKIESYLDDNRDYRILTHVAWRQPALTGNATEKVRIYGGDVVASGSNLRSDQPEKMWEFEALMTLSQSKFLHIDADAVLRASGYRYDSSDYLTVEDLGLIGEEGEHYRNPKITTYRLSESQRVKSGNLYYFDHPYYGMIVKITPYS